MFGYRLSSSGIERGGLLGDELLGRSSCRKNLIVDVRFDGLVHWSRWHERIASIPDQVFERGLGSCQQIQPPFVPRDFLGQDCRRLSLDIQSLKITHALQERVDRR